MKRIQALIQKSGRACQKKKITSCPSVGEIFRQLPILLRDPFTNYVTKRFKVLPPTGLQLNITMMCNSRCLTCNIWRSKGLKELDTYQWKRILADPIFNNIEYLVVSGGEPTLRTDLPEIVRLCLDSMPNLRKLIIATNGLATDRITCQIPQIVDDAVEKRIKTTVSVSLDGVREKHDIIRGIPGHFEKTIQTIQYLKSLQERKGFRFGVATTISRFNVDDLCEISDFCVKQNLPVAYNLAWTSEGYYKNLEREKDILVPDDKITHLIGFLTDKIAEGSVTDGRSYYYEKVIRMLEGKRRDFPCLFADQGIVLDSLGNIRYCNNSKIIGKASCDGDTSKIYYDQDNLSYRQNLKRRICPTCINECLVGIAVQKQLFPYISHLCRKLLFYSNFGKRRRRD